MAKQPYIQPTLVALGDVRSFTLGRKSYDTADMKNYYN
ncbi:MAG: putative RiPP precursor [Pseudonocardiales bacterium]|nr:putative RiPP precursor [Pseudonocardiales bacterium]